MTRPPPRRLFDFAHAFDQRITLVLALAVGALLLIAPPIILTLRRRGKLTPAHYDELIKRYQSWLILVPTMMAPVLCGAVWTILAVGLLGIFCLWEYARATGLVRERLMLLMAGIGILAVTFAELDNWYGLFVALWPLVIGGIATAAILQDHPAGFIHRVTLAVLGFVLFGSCLGQLGMLANNARFRAILFWLVIAVELNDIFAYMSGKLLGRRKLLPNTSPNKTIAGAVGALVLTTAFAWPVGHFVFQREPVDRWFHLLALGLIISIAGQLGDLLISSIKRDVQIKDMGSVFPGHGGVLDRFDSLLLVAPAVFYYLSYFGALGSI